MKGSTFFFLLVLFSLSAESQIPQPYGLLSEYFTGTTWDTTSRTWFEYNVQKLNFRETQEDFKSSINLWLKTYKFERTFNAQNDIEKEIRFTWNIGQSKWDSTSKRSMSYFKPGLVSVSKTDNYAGTWQTIFIDSNVFNANDQVIERKGYRSFNGGPMRLMSLNFSQYDLNDDLEQTLFLWYDTVNSSWDSTARSTFSRNLALKSDTVTRYEYYKALGWQKSDKSITVFDALDHIDYNENLSWNSSAMVWEPYFRIRYTYNADESTNEVFFEFYDDVEMDYIIIDRSTFLYGSPIGIPDQNSINSVLLFPNPVRDVLEIQLSSFTQATPIKIYSIKGKLVDNQVINSSSKRINTSGFESGTYVIVFPGNLNLAPMKFAKL